MYFCVLYNVHEAGSFVFHRGEARNARHLDVGVLQCSAVQCPVQCKFSIDHSIRQSVYYSEQYNLQYIVDGEGRLMFLKEKACRFNPCELLNSRYGVQNKTQYSAKIDIQYSVQQNLQHIVKYGGQNNYFRELRHLCRIYHIVK